MNTTATPQHNGYIQDNVYNVTWFILSKEVEEEVKEEVEEDKAEDKESDDEVKTFIDLIRSEGLL